MVLSLEIRITMEHQIDRNMGHELENLRYLVVYTTFYLM